MGTDDFCFVIMPFRADIEGVYFDAIKPAVESQGLRCIRVDEITDPGNIIKRIVEYIRTAKVVIADLSGKNANVFYELGIAHSMGNNTIVITQDDKDVPFDVKSYHYIAYKDSITGGRLLSQEIASKISSINDWSTRANNPVQDFLPEKMITMGQYKNALTELEIVKAKLSSSLTHLDDYEEMKRNYGSLVEQANELKTVQKYLSFLFNTNSVQDVYERVQREGEVSIAVESVNKGEKKNKIVFTKINEKKSS